MTATQFTPALQSAACVCGKHVVLQVFDGALQRNSPQLCWLPGRQLPWPLQLPGFVTLDAPVGHDIMLHVVSGPHLLHAPLPSQVPLFPQACMSLAGQLFSLSATPAGTLLQTPTLPGTLQARHTPVQASSQHTPSAQLLLAQSVATLQVAPRRFGPQRRSVHMLGETHSESDAHESKQAVPVALHR